MCDVVRAAPAVVHRGVGAEHVVVGEEVGEAELLDPLGVRPHRADVGADLGLREHDADAHRPVSTTSARQGPCQVPHDAIDVHQQGGVPEPLVA